MWAPSAPCISARLKRKRSSCCATPTTPASTTISGVFGFWEAFRSPEDLDKYPANPFTPLPPAEWTLERMRKVKYALAGTVDQVKAEIAALHGIDGKGELEWFGWFFDQGFMSMDEEMRQIELFAKHIIPAFR
jgi:hypothetical protein